MNDTNVRAFVAELAKAIAMPPISPNGLVLAGLFDVLQERVEGFDGDKAEFAALCLIFDAYEAYAPGKSEAEQVAYLWGILEPDPAKRLVWIERRIAANREERGRHG